MSLHAGMYHVSLQFIIYDKLCVRVLGVCMGACVCVCMKDMIASDVMYFAFEGYFHPRRSCISMLSRDSL